MRIIPVNCDCCGEMTDTYLDKSEWWRKYLKPEENKICPKCIGDRYGYAQEFLEKIGSRVNYAQDWLYSN